MCAHFCYKMMHYGIFVQCIVQFVRWHYDDVIMGAMASQITSLTIVYSAVYSGADQSKHQSSASLAFVWGIHRGPVNSPHKWPVTRKMFPFDDVIMGLLRRCHSACPNFNGDFKSTHEVSSGMDDISLFRVDVIAYACHILRKLGIIKGDDDRPIDWYLKWR